MRKDNMSYSIGRSYNTDLSRSDVTILLSNIAHTFHDDLPVKSVFKTAEIVDEDDNHFSVEIRPSVVDAGYDAGDLLWGNVTVRGTSVVLVGAERTEDGREYARVKVFKGSDSRCVDIERYEQ